MTTFEVNKKTHIYICIYRKYVYVRAQVELPRIRKPNICYCRHRRPFILEVKYSSSTLKLDYLCYTVRVIYSQLACWHCSNSLYIDSRQIGMAIHY